METQDLIDIIESLKELNTETNDKLTSHVAALKKANRVIQILKEELKKKEQNVSEISNNTTETPI